MEVKKVSNLNLLRGVWTHRNSLTDYIQHLRNQHGELMKFSFGSMEGLFLNGPEHVRAVLLERWSQYPKSRRYKTLSPLIGNSIMVANGEEWKEKRLLAQPVFQARAMALYKDIIEKEVFTLIDKFKDGEVINAYDAIAPLTFKIISKVMFSDDIDDVFDEFNDTILKIQNECTIVTLWPFQFMDKAPLPANIKFKRLSAKMQKIIDDVIQRRINNPRASEYKDLLARYLSVIKEEKKSFSMEDLRNELITAFIAGNESTTLGLCWGLYELARPQHMAIQDRLGSEVRSVPHPIEEDQVLNFLKSLSYMNQVINENLRMHPPVWLFTREAAKDDDLLGIKVKKGTLIIISPYFLHRNENHWKDPEVFDPSRFAENVDEDAFIPFAKGPRNCIGMPLSTLELQLFFYHFFRRFSISSVDGKSIGPKPLVNLYPEEPIMIKLKHRGDI